MLIIDISGPNNINQKNNQKYLLHTFGCQSKFDVPKMEHWEDLYESAYYYMNNIKHVI